MFGECHWDGNFTLIPKTGIKTSNVIVERHILKYILGFPLERWNSYLAINIAVLITLLSSSQAIK
jgi:hypothetical protein